MSGRVQVARYMHLPMIARKGSVAASARSASFCGHISLLRRVLGQGVVTELQCSMSKSRRMAEVKRYWSIIRIRRSRLRVIRQPRIHSAGPQSVHANFSLISRAGVSDSGELPEAMIMSSTLVADIEKPDEEDRL